MDLKLRNVRGFNNRQDDWGSGSLRTRPVPRTVPEIRNALPVPPTTSPGTQNGLASLRRPDGISSPDYPSSHLPSLSPPAPRPFCARLSPGGPLMFLQSTHLSNQLPQLSLPLPRYREPIGKVRALEEHERTSGR